MNALTPIKSGEIIEAVIARGDIAQLSPQERAKYYVRVCESIGLNPMSRPFEYITLNGKLTLYARKDCTDQLRTMHDVSVTDLIESERDGVFIVTAKVRNGNGRTDASKGAVFIGGLKGEALANALMKTETKAKRRATLSICGLGFLDETEVEDIADKIVHEPPTPPAIEAPKAEFDQWTPEDIARAEAGPVKQPITTVADTREPPTPPDTDALGGKPESDAIPPGLRRATKPKEAPPFKIDNWLATLKKECEDKTPAQLLDLRMKMIEPLRERLGHDGYNKAGDVMGAAMEVAQKKYAPVAGKMTPEIEQWAADVFNADAWYNDLSGAISGCTTIEQILEVQKKVQQPARENVSDEHWARGRKLVSAALVQLSDED